MRRPPRCFALTAALGAAALAAAGMLAGPGAARADDGEHQIVSSVEVRIGRFVRTDWTVQIGANPVNRFTMHRLVQGADERRFRAALLLLPPLGNGFNFFEVDENGVYDRSFAAFFASRGFAVWGYTPRGTGLVAGTCESGALDCSPMAHWDCRRWSTTLPSFAVSCAAPCRGIVPATCPCSSAASRSAASPRSPR